MKGIGMKRFSGISVAVAVLAATTLAGCPKPPKTTDINTQQFAAGAAKAALEGKQLYYQTDGSLSFYSRTVTDNITDFLNSDTQVVIDFSVADPFVLNLASGSEVIYYGQTYSTLYIGSDGTVSFGTPGTGNGSLAAYFSAKQVSLLPVDAADDAETGTVSYGVFSDQVVVTFNAVDGSSFQGVFYISGPADEDIAVVYPIIDDNVAGGVVGLSRGQLVGLNEAEREAFLAGFRNSDLGKTNTKTGA